MTRYERIRARGKDRPESPGQARCWETVRGKYVAAGLCSGCAAQAAWGHQNGFANIAPPCSGCAPVVTGFDRPAGLDSPWRRAGRGTGGAVRVPHSAVSVAPSVPASAGCDPAEGRLLQRPAA